MSDHTSDGIHLTKEYAREEFIPYDLQWNVSEIANDFTLYDLFCLVYKANLITPGIAASMGMSNFEAFWDQINLDREQDDISDVEYLELYWSPGYDTRTVKRSTPKPQSDICKRLGLSSDEDYFDDPKVAEMTNLMSFQGIGPGCPSKDLDFHECGDDCPKDTAYAIEFSPVNNLAHLPVRVSPKVSFFPPYVETGRDFHRTGFELTIQPTLWCLITSIFWELTFVSSDPSDIADSKADLMDRVDEAKAHFDQMNDDEEEEDESNGG
jgi:hypothetical protein